MGRKGNNNSALFDEDDVADYDDDYGDDYVEEPDEEDVPRGQAKSKTLAPPDRRKVRL